MNLRTLTNLAVATAIALMVTACSNGSSSGPNPPNNPVSIAFATQPVTSLTAGKTTSITAIVSNDSSNAGVKWSVSCSSTGSACGSLSSATSANGTAVTYTAPTTVPSGGGIVNVVATAAADSTQSVTGTITVTAVPQAVLNDGTYIFHTTGWDANGPVYLAGAFIVKNAVITGGEQDFTDSNGVGHTDQLVAAGSTLSAAGGNIQVTLATSNPNIGVSGIEVFRGNKVSSSRFLISEFDTSAATSGSIDLQTSTATPTGGYVFGLNGQDSGGTPFVIGGILNFSGASLVSANSVFDYNDGGAVGQAQTFTSGSISAPDSFGRATINLTPTGVTNGVPQFTLAAYVIGNGQLQLVESGSDVLQATLGGLALSQGGNAGHFTAGGITGASYAYYASGFSTKNYLVIGGGFGFNSDGTISGAMVYNDFESPVGNQITAGTYTISPLGRVAITGAAPQPLNLTLNFQFYLDGNGNAIELGVDGNQVSEGPSFLQQAPGSSYQGTYAIAPQGVLNIQGYAVPWGSVGPMTVTLGNISGFTDYNAAGATPTSNVTLGGTEDSTNGLFHISGLNGGDLNYLTGWGYYPVDANRVIAIETDKNAVSTMMLESNGTISSPSVNH